MADVRSNIESTLKTAEQILPKRWYLYTKLYGGTSLAAVTTPWAPHNFLPTELQYSRQAAISHDSIDSQNPIFPRDTTNSSSLKYPTGGGDVLPRYLLNCPSNFDGTSLPRSYNSVIKKKIFYFSSASVTTWISNYDAAHMSVQATYRGASCIANALYVPSAATLNTQPMWGLRYDS